VEIENEVDTLFKEHVKKTRAASQDAAHRAQRVADEAEEAAKAMENARRTIEKASKELESFFQEPTAR
jgi:methyl-accepting chemotaxis protein